MTAVAPRRIHPMPFTRIELCVFGILDGQLSVVLGRREEPPAQGRWALPGGVLRTDVDQSLEGAALRVGQERLGVALPHLRQQQAIGGPSRDPRAPWTLSIVYRSLVDTTGADIQPGKRLAALRWTPVAEAAGDRSLAFDHATLIRDSAAELRAEIGRLDFPEGFLSESFTLGELQQRCEDVLGRKLDKSSFRRRVADRGCVAPVEGEFRGGANRPAQVFRLVTPEDN